MTSVRSDSIHLVSSGVLASSAMWLSARMTPLYSSRVSAISRANCFAIIPPPFPLLSGEALVEREADPRERRNEQDERVTEPAAGGNEQKRRDEREPGAERDHVPNVVEGAWVVHCNFLSNFCDLRAPGRNRTSLHPLGAA